MVENAKTQANLRANVRSKDGYVLAVDGKRKQRSESALSGVWPLPILSKRK